MASLTISNVVTSGVTLTMPTTITATGTVTSLGSAAVSGAGSNSLTNAGQIAGEVFGVSLANGGNITNAEAGVISGASGIALFGSGTIDNAGIVDGGATGITLSTGYLLNESSGEISGGVTFTTGTLTNEGVIARATGNIVYFAQGGTVLNLGATANLSGDVVGVAIAGASGQVTNQGTISGVELLAGGTVTNSGYLSTGNASFGVAITQGAGYVQNTGHIVGVDLANGGKVVNAGGGIISGYVDGVDLGAGGSISNNGSILGIGGRLSAVQSGHDGISLSGSGTITNAAGAVIQGSNDGIIVTGTGFGSITITNSGLITGKKGIIVDTTLATTIFDYGTVAGTGGTAIAFEGGNDVLVLGSNALIEGIIVGGGSTQQVSLTIEGTLSSASSDIQLQVGGNLVLNGAVAASQTISFAGTDARLAIGDASQFHSEIAGMASGDMIDLTNDAFQPGAHAYVTTNNMLEIVGADTTSLQLDPTQNFAHEYFHILSDGLNGMEVTESSVPCFLAGTAIAVPGGEAQVQKLSIGDLVSTGAGLAKPVKWIGRRSYSAPLAEDPDVIPVLIKAGALAPDVPKQDLYLSPRHAVLVDGFLVPAGALINGVSVLSCPDIKTIHYYHIEMEQHDTVIANGTEAETFIDHDSREMFENADEFYRLYPRGWAASAVLCAPRLEFGAELEGVRRKIALRAGLLLDQIADGAVIGFLEAVDRRTITGWACAPAQPNVPVSLGIYNRGALLARTVANLARPDVRAAGFGNGRCGFKVTLPAPLPALLRHEISVMPIGSSAPLPGSPVVLDPAIAHDLLKTGGLKTLLEAAVKGLSSDHDIASLGHSLEAAGRQIRQGAEMPRRIVWSKPQSENAPVVLVIDNKWPTVTLDAGSNAIMSHVRSFQALGYRVAFCATGGLSSSMEEAAGLHALQELGVACYGEDGEAVETIIRRLAAAGLHVVYLHRLAIASAYGVLVRQYAHGAKVIFAVADLHHLRLARQAAVCNRPDLAFKARSVKAAELWAMQLSDCVITHSRAEAAYLSVEAPFANVHLVPWAVALQASIRANRNRRDIAFIGGAGHAPNLDAVTQLVREIMPSVWEKDPSIRCLIAGAAWPLNLFSSVDPRIVNLGHQQDLQPLLRSIRLTVAPLRFGAGIKGKVLESMAAGVPCVMSLVAAEGLPFEPNLNALIDDGTEFVDKVLQLYSDKKRHRIMVRAGLDMIETNFSIGVVTAALAQALGNDCPATDTRTARAEPVLALA